MMVMESGDNIDGQEPTYPVKSVTFTTCADLYRKWSSRKRMYAKATAGLTLTVDYVDTAELCVASRIDTNRPHQQEMRTILALHGAPGSHEDFKPFIEHFGAHNVRIVVPNFPDYNLTIRSKVFRHSAEEKFHFVKDFLQAIDLSRIDLLLAHSSAVYPAAMLMLDEIASNIEIKSIALFNAAGHRRIIAMRPAWLTEGSVKVYQNKFGRMVFQVFGKSFIKATNSVTVKPESMNNVMLSAQTMRYSNYKEFDKYLIKLKQSGKPILWAFSENDRLVEKEIFYEMVDIMGAKESNYQKYDCNAKPMSEYDEKSNLRILAFESGGHYAFLKYAEEVIKECDKFLNFVTHFN